MKKETLDKIIKGYNAVIYQVDKSEYEAKETDNKSEKSKSKVNKKTLESEKFVPLRSQGIPIAS